MRHRTIRPYLKTLSLVLSLTMCSFFLSSCAARLLEVPQIAQSQKRVVVFIPGYKGSSLVEEESNESVWISGGEALFGSKTLAFDLPELGVEGAKPLVSNGVLRSIPLIPLLYSLDAYGICLGRIRDIGSAEVPVIPFAYDWRRDNVDSVRKLDALVSELEARGVEQIDVVAHSMGGLLLAYYLRYGTQEPETAVETWSGAERLGDIAMTGVPFRGTMLMFRDMNKGTRQGLNSKLLDRTAISTFESSYQLLPDTPSILTANMQPFTESSSDTNFWLSHGWGLPREEAHSSFKQARDAFTLKRLQRAQSFKAKLLAPAQKVPTFSRRMINLIGESHRTLSKGIYVPSARSVLFDTSPLRSQHPGLTDEVLFEDGDGVVEVAAARLPGAYLRAFDASEVRLPEKHQYICGGQYAGRALESFFTQR